MDRRDRNQRDYNRFHTQSDTEPEIEDKEHISSDIEVVNVYAIIIVLYISIDNNNIRTRSLRNTYSQETQHLSWETL